VASGAAASNVVAEVPAAPAAPVGNAPARSETPDPASADTAPSAAPGDGSPAAAADSIIPPADPLEAEAAEQQPATDSQLAVVAPSIEPAEVLPPDVTARPPAPPAPPGGGGEPPKGRGKRRRPLPEPEDKPMSIVEHLDELRRRLMWMIGSLLVGVAVGFAFVKQMLDFLEGPLHGMKLYINAPLDPLFAFVKISVAFGLVVASPVILYQLTAYVLPALSRKERRMLFSYLPAATGLFLAGMAFGFFVFIPLVLDAMLRFAGNSLTPLLTIGNYISFLLSFTLPFGAVFEMPVAVVTLVKLNILSPQTLAAGRRWALMITVVIAAIFAPPDPITPLVMALPIYGLYEISIWVARLAARGRPTE
jgi:sec-independent protein translocase protein TatC